uniref:Uncharacterized protein n=1 Tax=Kalanchoe fedtschenkoi TaxID=63787 RepID=A0A7N0TAE8_KALFE
MKTRSRFTHFTDCRARASTIQTVTDRRRSLGCASMLHMDAKKLLKEKKFWFASILVVWAAGLQGQMMWLQRQDAFKQKFGNLNQKEEGET